MFELLLKLKMWKKVKIFEDVYYVMIVIFIFVWIIYFVCFNNYDVS